MRTILNQGRLLTAYLNQSQPYAYSRAGKHRSLWFEGMTLYSYALPIARWLPEGCLFIRERYSSITTNQHIRSVMLRWSSTTQPSLTRFVVPDVRLTPQQIPLSYWMDQVARLTARASRARSYGSSYVQAADQVIADARRFSDYFNLGWVVDEPQELTVLKVKHRLLA